jgi:hypothetical protein
MKRRNLFYGLPLQYTNGDNVTDMQTDPIKPSHYSRWKIEPIEFIRANNLDFYRANIIKYIMRHDAKDGLKDLEKALQYLQWFIDDMYPDRKETPVYRNEVAYPIVTRNTDFDDIIMTEEDLVMAERALYEGKERVAQGKAVYPGKW